MYTLMKSTKPHVYSMGNFKFVIFRFIIYVGLLLEKVYML